MVVWVFLSISIRYVVLVLDSKEKSSENSHLKDLRSLVSLCSEDTLFKGIKKLGYDRGAHLSFLPLSHNMFLSLMSTHNMPLST